MAKRPETRSHMASEQRGAKDRPSDPISGPSVLDAPTINLSVDQLSAWSTFTELKGEVSSKAQTAAVVRAGGRAERFGAAGGKQLFELLGRPVVTWSLEAFDAVPDVGQIVLVCPERDAERFCREALDPYPFVTPIQIAPSGDLRQESAFSGVCAVDERFEFIAMHDGARPLVTPDLIVHAINMIKGTLDAAGAIIGHPAIDTLKIVRGKQIIATPDRSAFWIAQTPQVFRAATLRRAHALALEEGFVGTDDSSLVERLDEKVLFINGPRDNIKLTVPEDLGPVEAALRSRVEGRDSGY
jgi:2-C-methyl-D-erythritol 4-phosphate cytidylyltransferase